MSCYDPVLCFASGTGKRTFRHFSKASRIIKESHNLVFDCGKCLDCRKKKARELANRCVLHASLYEKNCFLTLTYDEQKPDYHNRLQYEDIQKFKKNLRRQVDYHHGKKIEIFNVHEYGKNGKKHWHLIVFNHDFSDKELYTVKNGNRLYTSKYLETKWKFGFNTIGDVNEATAMYQAQYMQKDIKNGNTEEEKKSKSQHKGIGLPWFEKHYSQIMRLGYLPINGRKDPVPRAFEKRAHKHYSHFYEPWNFHDLPDRKRMYGPFKPGLENKNIADLWPLYKARKRTFIKDREEEFKNVMQQHLKTGNDPDFVKSGKNALYDLKNKNQQEKF